MKYFCYVLALDQMLSGLYLRLNQVNLNKISAMKN